MKNKLLVALFGIMFLCSVAVSAEAYTVNEWASTGWENYPIDTVDWEVVVKNGDGSNWNVGIYQPGGTQNPPRVTNLGDDFQTYDWSEFENPFSLNYSSSNGVVEMYISNPGGDISSTVVWDTGASFGYKDLYIVAKHTEVGQNTLIESVQLNGNDIGDITTGQVGGGPNYTKAGWHIEADTGEVFTDISITGFITFDQPDLAVGDSEFNAIFGAANPVPIPGAFWLLGSGIAGIVGFRKRSKN